MANLQYSVADSPKPFVFNPLELARVGNSVVGNQGLEAFCQKTKLSRSMVSRLLNGSLKSPPRVRTIYKFVEGNDAKAKEMLAACGYPFDALNKIYNTINSPVIPQKRFFQFKQTMGLYMFMLSLTRVCSPLYVISITVAKLYASISKKNEIAETSTYFNVQSFVDDEVPNWGNAEIKSLDNPTETKSIILFLNDKNKVRELQEQFSSEERCCFSCEYYEDSTSLLNKLDVFLQTTDKQNIIVIPQDKTEFRQQDNELNDYDTIDCGNCGNENLSSRFVAELNQSCYLLDKKDRIDSITVRSNMGNNSIWYAYIPAFRESEASNPNEVVVAATQNLKRIFIEHHKFTAKHEMHASKIIFSIFTNCGEVFDIFVNCFPNFELEINVIFTDGNKIIEQKNIPSLG